jgi:hypothetical protein
MITNPVIQIRNLTVSFGDSISFLSMEVGYAHGTSVAELCSAGVDIVDFAEDGLCSYVVCWK